jgi:hypothetical protein|tara:strand:+ start:919 stop:1506 length:588 start_codon:yes stop_codon:yes gene_type:complete
MPFWSENFGQDRTKKDPKRNFRFIVEFGGINATPGGAVAWYAKTVAKPSFTIANAEHKYLNHTFYYPAGVTWNPITITMVDPVDPDMAATFSDIIVQGGYSPPTDTTSLGTMSKAKAASALGAVTVTQIDSDGNPLETWTLWNPFIEDIKYGESLDYTNAELTEISITLRYDWARIETTNDSKAVTPGGREFFKV